MRTIYAGTLTFTDSAQYRRGRRLYMAMRMREPFIIETPIGRKLYPVDHLLVQDMQSGTLEAVAPGLFKQTFFRVPFCAPVEPESSAMQATSDNMTAARPFAP